MQTGFTREMLRDKNVAEAEGILRSCVHCGFCTATCPTYQVLGDELDSPRGRIYLIKDMLENGRAADAKTVKHIDRCLSCFACMSTCPSGVNYMHLLDHARAHIQKTYRRPIMDRINRWILAQVLPYPPRFRLAIRAANLARVFKWLLPGFQRNLINFAPKHLPPVSQNDRPQVFAAFGERKKRVALMTGCAQQVLNTDINDATIRLLQRLGCEVVVATGAACCGALTHHMGKTGDSHRSAANNINAWMAEVDGDGLDAIVINTSGCGTTVKDYGHMFRNAALAEPAAKISALAKDVSEVLEDLDLPENCAQPMNVAYHAACSLQHGQQIKNAPKDLLRRVGFTVCEPKDAYLCCGSAGTYNLLQVEIANNLKQRKVSAIEATTPNVICAGNLGCMIQIGSGTDIPVVHTVQLLDWATGGPSPRALLPERGK